MIYPDPKPAPNEPKARKPLKRTRVVTRRTKARKGRLRGNELGALREACFARDRGHCVDCGNPVRLEVGYRDSMEMAHIKGKRMFGDNLFNVRTKCFRCHRIIEHCNGGVEKIVPSKKKEEAMATVHIVRIENQDDMAGVARPGEPYPRPYVTLRDGRTMTFKEWTDAKQPA